MNGSYMQIVVSYICMYVHILSSPFFTRCPSRQGPCVMIKLPVEYQASTPLMISIYLTIILASSQGTLVDS